MRSSVNSHPRAIRASCSWRCVSTSRALMDSTLTDCNKHRVETAEAPIIGRRKPLTAKVGVFGVGHYAYWPQFDGLLDEMHRKLAMFTAKVQRCGVSVRDFGMVDDARGA